MTVKEFKITVHMVSSLDGFAASGDGSISWFETSCTYERGLPEEDPEEFLKTVDCYVMGSRTYELALELSKNYGWAYGDKPTIVLTRRELPKERKNIEFHSGDLKRFADDKLKPKYRNVWVVGGPMLVNEFIRLRLADEVRVSILPVLLGEGLPFFDHAGTLLPLHLKEAKAYRNGMVELCYGLGT